MVLYIKTTHKLLKTIVPLLTFITIFLLCFLLAGCAFNRSSFTDVYMVKLKFNESSSFFSNIQNAYALQNSSSKYANMTVRVGYLGMCVDLDGETTCSVDSQVDTKFSSFAGVSLGLELPSSSGYNTTASSVINLITIAKDFSNVCHPFTLIATLVISLILFLMIFWVSIPFFPWKFPIRKLTCLLSFANVLTWGLGSMLQQQAISTAKKIVGPSSLNILVCSAGSRSIAMTWTAFSFILLVFMGTLISFFQETKKMNKNSEPKM